MVWAKDLWIRKAGKFPAKRADLLNCEITTKIEVPKEEFLSQFDLNMMLSNLLENAIEALEKISDRRLEVYMKCKEGMLYVSVYNTFNGNVRKEGNRLVTTKKEKSKHGLGMNNVKAVVEKYDGSINIKTDKEFFKVDIILYLEPSQP